MKQNIDYELKYDKVTGMLKKGYFSQIQHSENTGRSLYLECIEDMVDEGLLKREKRLEVNADHIVITQLKDIDFYLEIERRIKEKEK